MQKVERMGATRQMGLGREKVSEELAASLQWQGPLTQDGVWFGSSALNCGLQRVKHKEVEVFPTCPAAEL